MGDVLENSRVRAEVRVELRQGRPIGDIMREISAGADLAILGIGLPDRPSDAEAEAFVDRISSMLDNLGTTILVHSARDFEGEPLLFARAE